MVGATCDVPIIFYSYEKAWWLAFFTYLGIFRFCCKLLKNSDVCLSSLYLSLISPLTLENKSIIIINTNNDAFSVNNPFVINIIYRHTSVLFIEKIHHTDFVRYPDFWFRKKNQLDCNKKLLLVHVTVIVSQK